MDPAVLTAVAAIGGSLVGGLTSFATTFVSQKLVGARERLLRELDRREDLYGEFVRAASDLMLDSIGRDLDEPARMVGLMAMTGRIRLISSEPVLRAADSLVSEILDSYRQLPADPVAALKDRTTDLVQPLILFTNACRTERLEMTRRI